MTPKIRQGILGMMTILALSASVKQTIEAIQTDLYANMDPIARPQDPKAVDFGQKDIFLYPSSLSSLLKTPTTKNDITKAKTYYKQHHFPTPYFHLDANRLPYMIQPAIEHSLVPSRKLVSGIDQYETANHIRATIPDPCLTGVMGRLLRMNIISNDMAAYLSKTDDKGKVIPKKVRTITDYLIKALGRYSLTGQMDNPQMYEGLQKGIIPDHYRETIRQAQTAQAGDLLIFRNANSGNIDKAISEGNQNGTHIAFCLGQITQSFSLDQLQLTPQDIPFGSKDTLSSEEEHNQKVFLIQHLMGVAEKDDAGKIHTRTPHDHALGTGPEQTEYISTLLSAYPDLVHISRDHITDTVSFSGTMIADDYGPNFGVRFVVEMLVYNQYGRLNAGSDAIGNNKFLLTNILRASKKATKFESYDTLSPLYQQIRTLQDDFLDQIKFTPYTHTFLRTDVYDNHNRPTKSASSLLNDLIESYYKGKAHLSDSYFESYKIDYPTQWLHHYNDIQKPLTKYIELMGMMESIPINMSIAFPDLDDPHTVALIDEIHQRYTDLMYRQFEPASQNHYYQSLHHNLQTLTASQYLNKHSVIVHPWTQGETKVNLTREIVKLYDAYMSRYFTDHPLLGTLPSTELENIFEYLKDDITIAPKGKDDITIAPKGIERGGEAIVYFKDIIKHMEQYTTFKQSISSPQISDIDASILGLPDEIATNLEIPQAVRRSLKHILIRESSHVDLLNPGNTRTRGKMMTEWLNLDNLIGIPDSEGAYQLRTASYLDDKSTLNLIRSSIHIILKNQQKIGLSSRDLIRAEELLSLTNQHINNLTLGDTHAISKSKKVLQTTLSNIIQLDEAGRYDKSNLGLNLITKLVSYNVEKHQRQYGSALLHASDGQPITKKEVAFAQILSNKTHQIGYKQGSRAFKIYMTMFLLSRGAMYDHLSMTEKQSYYDIINQLPTILKKEPNTNTVKGRIKKYIFNEKILNENRYPELTHLLREHYNSGPENPYIKEIIDYLNTDNHISHIPHYSMFKNITFMPGQTDYAFPAGSICVSGDMFDSTKRPELQPFNEYIEHLPSSQNEKSAMIRFAIAVLFGGLIYRNHRKMKKK